MFCLYKSINLNLETKIYKFVTNIKNNFFFVDKMHYNLLIGIIQKSINLICSDSEIEKKKSRDLIVFSNH